MNKYVVAYHNMFDGEVRLIQVEAESELAGYITAYFIFTVSSPWQDQYYLDIGNSQTIAEFKSYLVDEETMTLIKI